ncbi:MAG: hypothetical protein IJQ64_10010 [Prevotella sp.]|nr:hypothetical protein [Prevotella sp.]
METITSIWKTGDIVTLQRIDKMLKKNRTTAYKELVSSRYVCIREASNDQRGILVKVLGKIPARYLNIVDGKPFVKDDTEELFYDTNYYSFPFPKAIEIEEVLSIIRHNPELLNVFESISMHIDTEATFWVRETTRNMLFMKQLQFFDASQSLTCVAKENKAHYRLSIVYYYNSELVW